MRYDVGNAIQGAAGGAQTGGLWGAAAGAAIGGWTGSKTKRTALTAKEQLALAYWQNQEEERRMKNAHQWEAEDLIKAGFNPALTAAAPSAGAIAGNSGQAGNMLAQAATNLSNQQEGNLNRSIQSAKNAMDFFNDTQRIRTEANLANSRINNTDADTTTKNLNNEIVMKYGSNQAKQNLANSIIEGESIKAGTARTRAEIERLNQDIIQNTPQTGQDEQYNTFLRKHPKVAAGINAINRIADIGGNVMGAIGNAAKPFIAAKAVSNFKKMHTETTSRYNKRGELTSVTERHRY